jgi:hypothetical protein
MKFFLCLSWATFFLPMNILFLYSSLDYPTFIISFDLIMVGIAYAFWGMYFSNLPQSRYRAHSVLFLVGAFLSIWVAAGLNDYGSVAELLEQNHGPTQARAFGSLLKAFVGPRNYLVVPGIFFTFGASLTVAAWLQWDGRLSKLIGHSKNARGTHNK